MVSGDIENDFGEIIAVEYAKVDIETGEVDYEVLEFGGVPVSEQEFEPEYEFETLELWGEDDSPTSRTCRR